MKAKRIDPNKINGKHNTVTQLHLFEKWKKDIKRIKKKNKDYNLYKSA